MGARAAEKIRDKQEGVPQDVTRFAVSARKGVTGPHAYVVLLGMKDQGATKILRSAREGLPFHAFERFQRNAGLSQAQVATITQIAPRTLTRRKSEGRFRPDESDRLLRAGRVFGKALILFDGDRSAARNWLVNPQPALGGEVPLELIETEFGAREVEAVLGRIEHGVFS
jgi:putative toxin-antitoxin system antitoxin component (TIGR02293 family)